MGSQHKTPRLKRVFAALIPEREKIDATRALLQKKIRTGKWVEQENTHVTLAFFGECDPEKIRQIQSVFADFPQRRRVLIADGIHRLHGQKGDLLVLGFQKTEEERRLYSERSAFIQRLGEAGLYHEKKDWFVHLTLARKVKEEHRLSLTPFEIVFPRAVLYTSVLTDKGPVYRVLTPDTPYNKE